MGPPGVPMGIIPAISRFSGIFRTGRSFSGLKKVNQRAPNPMFSHARSTFWTQAEAAWMAPLILLVVPWAYRLCALSRGHRQPAGRSIGQLVHRCLHPVRLPNARPSMVILVINPLHRNNSSLFLLIGPFQNTKERILFSANHMPSCP